MDLVHVISEYINQHYGSANGIGEQLKYNYNDMRVIDLNRALRHFEEIPSHFPRKAEKFEALVNAVIEKYNGKLNKE